jgi:hypothetical protein
VASVTERCPTRVELNDVQVRRLDSRPHGTNVAERHYDCDLENGHEGPHASLGQPSNDAEWWIYWTLSASEIREVAACPAIRPVARGACGGLRRTSMSSL